MKPFLRARFNLALCLLVLCLGACDEDLDASVVYAQGGVWEDPATGLIWQQDPPAEFVSWLAAMEYCDAVVLDGHDDWRLPTISELRSLITDCQGTATGGKCEVSDECAGDGCSSVECYSCVYGDGPSQGCFSAPQLLKPCEHYWSSTLVTDYVSRAWAVGFSSGFVYKPRTVYSFHARCVR